MNPLLEKTKKRMGSPLGVSLLTELWDGKWEKANTRILDDLGVAIATNPGVRRVRNEDRLAFAQVNAANNEIYIIAIVCDGVGGSELGDIAATLGIASILNELAHHSKKSSLIELADNLVRKADIFIREELAGKGTTTLSMMLVSPSGECAAVNIGDSRIYAWLPNKILQQISVDDTIENELRGFLIKNQGILDARGLRGRLSQALGETGRTSADLRVIVFDEKTFVNRGVVIATDGVWKSVEEGFKSIILNASSAQEAVKRSVAFAIWTGGIDNISIIAINDLQQMAASIFRSNHSNYNSISITAWIGDTKFTSVESIESDNLKSRPPSFKSEVADKKQKKSSNSRKKPISNKTDTSQLQITESSNSSNRDSPRTEIEITIETDDNSKK